MKLFKPKFWQKENLSFWIFFLLPFTLLIKFLFFLKKKIETESKLTVPTICVGNIYLGGTGKTPICIEIYNILESFNKKPFFIKKKYPLYKDESLLLKKVGKLCENTKRVNAAKEAIDLGAETLVFDDGFQDNTFKKNLSIICFKEKQWIGNGFTIPSGPLREDLSSVKNAQCIIINGGKNMRIENKVLSINSDIKIFYSNYIPKNIDNFINKKIIAFAGIGDPEEFFSLLDNFNLNLIEKISFPDHYNYKNYEIENLISKSNETRSILLTTEKDYCRINKIFQNKINYIKIKVDISDRSKFINMLRTYI